MSVPRRSEVRSNAQPGRLPHLQLVDADLDDLDGLISERDLEEDQRIDPDGFISRWSPDLDLDGWLHSIGVPVAIALDGTELDVPDEDVDVAERAITNIEIARLRRFLRQLPPVESKVMRLVWGIGCPAHSVTQAAARTGLSTYGVSRALEAGMAHLRRLFGVADEDQAA